MSSPRLFGSHGEFLPLSDVLEASLKEFDAGKHERYLALKDAALAAEAAEANVKALEKSLADARTRYQNTIKSRDRQFPKLTQNDLAKQFARTEHLKRAISRGVLSAVALAQSPLAAADQRAGNNLLAEFNHAIQGADLLVATTQRELADARVAVKAARAKLAECWRAHVAQWPSLTAEENARERIASEQARRRKEQGGRNAMGDTIETIQFVAKQMQTGNHRGGQSKISLLRARAQLKRQQNEARHGGNN